MRPLPPEPLLTPAEVAAAGRRCTQVDCLKVVNARGLCGMHYKRFRLYGDPNATPRFSRNPAERFWRKVAVGTRQSCWHWTCRINNNGYGIFRMGSGAKKTDRSLIAHRVAYELVIGPIPAGMQIDHLCRSRACVNPYHLEPVSPGENSLRSLSARKTHCFYGHELTVANTYRQPSTGRRSCVTCRRIRSHGGKPSLVSDRYRESEVRALLEGGA